MKKTTSINDGDRAHLKKSGANVDVQKDPIEVGDGCLGARVLLYEESEVKGAGKFFVIPRSTSLAGDDKDLRKALAQRCLGRIPDQIVTISVGGVVMDDARLLREGDRAVLTMQAKVGPQATLAPVKEVGRREVFVGFIINNVKAIDAIANSVYVDFQLYLKWHDPTLVGIPVDGRPPYTEEHRGKDDTRECLWNPQVEVNNDLDLETLWAVYPASHQDVATGMVVFGARYRGHVSNPMDLHLFPFDADDFAICVGPKSLDRNACILVIDDSKHGCPNAPGDRIKECQLEEWDLGDVKAIVTESLPSGSGAIYSNAKLEVQVFRRVNYYFWKVLSMKMILIFSCFSVFHQDPLENFSDRQGHTFTLALTVVAFLYVAGQDLPKVSYLTIMDKMMLLGFAILFLTSVESFIAFLIAKGGNKELAEKIDWISFFVFPSAYVLTLAILTAFGVVPRRRMWQASRRAADEEKQSLVKHRATE